MRLKQFAIFFGAFSLAGCQTFPPVNSCVMDPDTNVLWCYPIGSQNDADGYKVKFEDAENYTCFSPNDSEALLNWIKRHSKKGMQ